MFLNMKKGNQRLLIVFLIVSFVFIYQISKRNTGCWLDHARSRLLCFVLTTEDHIDSRARAVYETWGHRCGKFLFISRWNNSLIKQLPIENIPQLPNEFYSNLPGKVRRTLLYLNEFYPNYDWYLKADDDTFIIVENLLRFLISTIKRSPQALLYGYRFREDYYVSGGGGYVLTRQGLQLYSKHMNDERKYAECNSTMEDLMVGACLKRIFTYESKENIEDLTIVGDSVDSEGRERFHPLAFRLHFNGPANKLKREWIHFRPFQHNIHGYEGISETTISFHYTSSEDMYQMDSFIYQIRQFDKQICLV